MSTLKANNDDSSSSEPQPAEDDEYYMHGMAEILDAFPKSGPPDHPTRLSEHLYIGNQDNADDAQLLSALDITHVLNMAGTRVFDLTRSPYKPESGIRSFLMMPAEDFEEFDILPHLLEAIAFLSRAESSGGCAFVHCNYGVNRSGVVAAAYLMVSERKPLLQVINELKARRSLILSNVGFRRQLVRFARCRGLLDPVERPSRRSPRLEPGERTPRGVTPSKDKTTDETKDESSAPESAESSAVKETNGMNGEVPPRNGYHDTPPAALTIATELKQNGVMYNGSVRPRTIDPRRERLLRDIDSTIGTLSDADISSSTYSTYYRPRDDVDWVTVSSSVPVYEHPRPSSYFPIIEHTPYSVPVSYSAQFDVADHPYSSDSDDEYTARNHTADRSVSFYSTPEPPNAILDEYLQYKSGSTSAQFAASTPTVLPVHALPAAELSTSTVKPRYYYSRSPVTVPSVIRDYDEADIKSFLAQRNARRPMPPSSTLRHANQAITGLDPRRRSTSSTDAIRSLPRPHSTGKTSVSPGGGYKASPGAGLLPTSAYLGRWYAGSTSSATGRRYSTSASVAAHASYLMGMMSFDSEGDISYDPISGHGMRLLGRTIATRVTPAPGYGPRSSYARAHSLSRLM